jgi:hypothetical protein
MLCVLSPETRGPWLLLNCRPRELLMEFELPESRSPPAAELIVVVGDTPSPLPSSSLQSMCCAAAMNSASTLEPCAPGLLNSDTSGKSMMRCMKKSSSARRFSRKLGRASWPKKARTRCTGAKVTVTIILANGEAADARMR